MNSEKKKILIIEDEEVIASVVQDNLEARGYETIVAHSGMEGLRKTEIYSPDLIALDIMMPGMDGINVLKRLKANKDTADIPVILISIAEGYQKEGLKLGAAAFIRKPFDFNDLTEKIKSFTDKKTVMVVEDNEHTLKLIELRLKMVGYDVIGVSGGEELFRELELKEPDIILMDIVLPGQDGLELIRKIKSSNKYSDIPVIVFSGYVSDELSGKEIAGADKFIKGEISPENLADEVMGFLERGSSDNNKPAPAENSSG